VSDELTREAIAAVDPQDTLGDVLAQPHQVGDALWRVESAGIPRSDLPGGLLVAGMGGSAIGAELAAAALGARARRPIRSVRDYTLETWTGPETFVLCSSYSGDTEETLACFEDATERGCPGAVVTTGGLLAERAREEGVPVIGVPAGMQPRAAVIYGMVAALECAALAGAAPSSRSELEGAQPLLARLVDEWGPDAPEGSVAKSLARELQGTIPVFYGADQTVAVAKRWRTQFNENPKLPAFWGELPEADHNEVCGWDRASELGRMHSVFLDSPDIDERARRRFGPTARIATPSTLLDAVGENLLERVLSLVLLGDLVSTYVAVLDGVDPSTIEAIDRLKAELQSQD
jgi:glucose/mannose-6-phosphate isomerase